MRLIDPPPVETDIYLGALFDFCSSGLKVWNRTKGATALTWKLDIISLASTMSSGRTCGLPPALAMTMSTWSMPDCATTSKAFAVSVKDVLSICTKRSLEQGAVFALLSVAISGLASSRMLPTTMWLGLSRYLSANSFPIPEEPSRSTHDDQYLNL